ARHRGRRRAGPPPARPLPDAAPGPAPALPPPGARLDPDAAGRAPRPDERDLPDPHRGGRRHHLLGHHGGAAPRVGAPGGQPPAGAPAQHPAGAVPAAAGVAHPSAARTGPGNADPGSEYGRALPVPSGADRAVVGARRVALVHPGPAADRAATDPGSPDAARPRPRAPRA